MYLFMYVSQYVCIYVCMYQSMYVCMYVCVKAAYVRFCQKDNTDSNSRRGADGYMFIVSIVRLKQ